jgi:hypothetical protein
LLEDKRIRDYVTTYFSKGFIAISSVSYAAPILFVKKPGSGICFCIDYRKLNIITKKNTHLIPLIEETLAALNRTVIMSKLDIRHTFNRIRFKTTANEDLIIFKTSIGIFKYLVVLFRLVNRPAVFQRKINKVLFEYLHHFCIVYINNVLIYSKSKKEHV